VRDGDYTWAHAAAIWRAVCEKLGDCRRSAAPVSGAAGARAAAAAEAPAAGAEAADTAAGRPSTAWARSRAAESTFEAAELRQLRAQARVEDSNGGGSSSGVGGGGGEGWLCALSFDARGPDDADADGGLAAAPGGDSQLRRALSTLAAEERALAAEVSALRRQVRSRRFADAKRRRIS
jgi:hypothetical protein